MESKISTRYEVDEGAGKEWMVLLLGMYGETNERMSAAVKNFLEKKVGYKERRMIYVWVMFLSLWFHFAGVPDIKA